MVRGNFTSNAMLIADAAREQALQELNDRNKTSFYATTSDDESWRHERTHRRNRREHARFVLSQAGEALEPTSSPRGVGSGAADTARSERSARRSEDDLESALQMHYTDAEPKRDSPATADEDREAPAAAPESESRWAGIRRTALPTVRLGQGSRITRQSSAHFVVNEARQSLVAMPASEGVNASVHLAGSLPGTLGAETEVAAMKSRKLRDVTRVMLIEETYEMRKRTLSMAEGGTAHNRTSPASRASSFSALARDDSPARESPGGPPAAGQLPQRASSITGLAKRVALYTHAATRAVADARKDLQLNTDWLRWLMLARTQLCAVMTDPSSSVLALAVYWIVVAAILMSSTTFCLETVSTLNTPSAQIAFRGVENTSIAIFTAEYAARLLSTPNLRVFFASWLNTIDLAAILPFYVERGLVTSGDSPGDAAGQTRIVRVLRLARVLRVLKLGHRSVRIGVVNRALAESSDMLVLLIFLLCICVVVCSSAMYYAERGTYQPQFGFASRMPFDQTCRVAPICTALETARQELCCMPKPSPFYSIPAAFWWCIVTLMTVGYGEVVPVTPGGKIVASVTMVLAVLLLSLPISVIGTEFTQQWLEYKAKSHMPDKRHKAPRFMTLRRALAAHNSLLDELLLKTRDVLFEIDDLMARLQDKATQKRRNSTAISSRFTSPVHVRGKAGNGGASASASSLTRDTERGTLRRLGALEEAAARDVQHETELLVMELELKQRLLRLQELLTQADLVRDPAFLLALEQCRGTYGGLRALARDVATLTEEADDVEEALDEALTEELDIAAQAAAAAVLAQQRGQHPAHWASTVLSGSLRASARMSSGSTRSSGGGVTRTNTASVLVARLASALRRSPAPGPGQPGTPPRWRASVPLPGRTSAMDPTEGEEGEQGEEGEHDDATHPRDSTPRDSKTPRDGTPRTPAARLLAANTAPLLPTRFGVADDAAPAPPVAARTLD